MKKSTLQGLVFIVIASFSLSGCLGPDQDSSNKKDTGKIDTDNPPSVMVPTSNAGVNQNVKAGTLVILDGSKSYSSESKSLTYRWSLLSFPSNSQAVLSMSDTVSPSFTPDVDGEYVALLIVNDGMYDSLSHTVKITATKTENSAPIANAGNDQNIATRRTVYLDGNKSSDADGDRLTFLWTIDSKPAASSVTLDNNTTKTPSFYADVDGEYVIQLIVNDGSVNSEPAKVRVTAATLNSAPVANAGADQENVIVGKTVVLDGSGSSDANFDPLTYSWSFISKPINSLAEFGDDKVINPSFIADIKGEYVISLTVNDGELDSVVDSVVVKAVLPHVKMFVKPLSSINATYSEVNLPFSSTGNNVQANVSGIPTPTTYTLGTFKLKAIGADYTVISVLTTCSHNSLTPSFTGISEDYVIKDGTEIEFSLVSPLTRGKTITAGFSFKIKETGETFNSNYTFTSN